jgi:hypothetical protein
LMSKVVQESPKTPSLYWGFCFWVGKSLQNLGAVAFVQYTWFAIAVGKSLRNLGDGAEAALYASAQNSSGERLSIPLLVSNDQCEAQTNLPRTPTPVPCRAPIKAWLSQGVRCLGIELPVVGRNSINRHEWLRKIARLDLYAGQKRLRYAEQFWSAYLNRFAQPNNGARDRRVRSLG